METKAFAQQSKNKTLIPALIKYRSRDSFYPQPAEFHWGKSVESPQTKYDFIRWCQNSIPCG
ncbi:unnamed protein product, partial [Nesidiocoris tenuis]